MKKDIIVKVLEEYNNEEQLIKEKANRYYETLEISEETILPDIKKRYRELSITNHPDKGGDAQLFQLINNAHEVLGDEIKKKKYDFGLLREKDGTYLNRKKLSKIKKSGELVNEEFGKNIELILQDELKINNFTWEDLIDYGERV